VMDRETRAASLTTRLTLAAVPDPRSTARRVTRPVPTALMSPGVAASAKRAIAGSEELQSTSSVTERTDPSASRAVASSCTTVLRAITGLAAVTSTTSTTSATDVSEEGVQATRSSAMDRRR